VAAVVDDRRFAEHLLTREHQRLCRTEPERDALRDEVARFRKAPSELVAIYSEWLLGPEWELRLERRRPLSNRAWVKALFVALFDRLPGEDEGRRMRDALDGLSDPRPLRALLTRLLLNGPETPLPTEAELGDESGWVRALFQRLLGREATAEEARVFVHTLRTPDCTPKTLLLALLTSTAFQED